MSVWLWCRRAFAGVPFVLVILWGLFVPTLSAQQEPSPISVELAVPTEAGPGSIVEVLIQYDAVDLNAGADLNYNVFGPAHVLRRSPEPPNAVVNTWNPGKSGMPAKGTIKIELQVHGDALGQAIEHQVEVRWGPKVRVFGANTSVKSIAPTAVPTSRPRPQPTRPPSTSTPGPTPTAVVKVDVQLESVAFVDDEANPLVEAVANQEVYLEASYSSSADLRDVRVEIRFEPAVVQLEGLEAEGGSYWIDTPVLAAAQSGDLLESVSGQIRSFADGGQEYALRAFVRIVPAEESVEKLPEEMGSEPVRISQSLDLVVRTSVDAEAVQAGGSFVAHVVVENHGSMPARQVRIKLAGLPEGFVAAPDAQEIAVVPAEGGSERRLFTVRTAEGYNGPVVVRVVASAGDLTVLAEPVTLKSEAPVPLRLEVESNAQAVYAGEAAYIRVSAENIGSFPANDVTARLIDATGTLGVLVEDVGEVPANGSAEWVFVVDIPESFPIDAEATFVVQTVSADGLVSESSYIPLSIACRPQLEVYGEPPIGQIVGGQAVETIVLVKNTGPCVARDVVVGIDGLPGAFTRPPDLEITELPAGGVRYLSFNMLVPQAFRGEAGYYARVEESTGGQALSEPAGFAVGGMSIAWSVVLGILALLAMVAMVVGTVLYIRAR